MTSKKNIRVFLADGETHFVEDFQDATVEGSGTLRILTKPGRAQMFAQGYWQFAEAWIEEEED